MKAKKWIRALYGIVLLLLSGSVMIALLIGEGLGWWLFLLVTGVSLAGLMLNTFLAFLIWCIRRRPETFWIIFAGTMALSMPALLLSFFVDMPEWAYQLPAQQEGLRLVIWLLSSLIGGVAASVLSKKE